MVLICCMLFVIICISLSEVIEHEILSRQEHPCESSPHYSFGDCVFEKISKEVGCQSFWTNYSDIPYCGRNNLFAYKNLYLNYTLMEKRKLQKETGCLDPCSYTEYKVKTMSLDPPSFTNQC